MQVVVQGFALAQKFGAKQQVGCTQGLDGFGGVAHGHGALDHHHRLGIDGHHVFNDRFDALGIKVVGGAIVVGRSGNNYVVCTFVGFLFVERCTEIQWLAFQEMFDFGILDRRLFTGEYLHLIRVDVKADNIIFLS